MAHTPHELAEEFPEYHARIHELKTSDGHFARIVEEYHQINRAVHRAETNIEPVSEHHEEDMRKKRLALKDEIFRALIS